MYLIVAVIFQTLLEFFKGSFEVRVVTIPMVLTREPSQQSSSDLNKTNLHGKSMSKTPTTVLNFHPINTAKIKYFTKYFFFKLFSSRILKN